MTPARRSALTALTALTALLLGTLGGCKRSASGPSAAEVEALDYVRLVQVALSNAYMDGEQTPVPATPCTDPLFGMKKTTRNLTLNRCLARMDDPATPLVTAVFNDDLAVLGDSQGVRVVQVSDLPELP